MTPISDVSRVQKLAEKLKRRLVRRPTADGVVFTLDLRAKVFTGLPSSRITLRAPQDAGWPELGRTTDDDAEAHRWIDEAYAGWIARALDLAGAGDDRPETVRQAAERFVKTLAVPVRDRHGQIVETVLRKDRSMMSMIRNHVVPSLGHLPLAALDPESVGKAATTFEIRKADSAGRKSRRLASPGTQRRFLAALSVIWRHTYPFRPIPWKGVRIVEKVDAPADSDLVSGFDDESILLGDEDTGALTQEELVRTLVAAEYRDQQILREKKSRNSFVPNTPHAIAMQVGLGPRVSELVDVRWGHIFTKGHVILRNAKVQQVLVKKRAVPTQHSLQPWIEELRVREGEALHHNGFVIRTNPRGGVFAKAAITTLANRISAALELAGVKRPGKATHGLRATFASHADACPDITGKMVQRYLGHHRVYGKSTDEYVRQMIGMIRESHRNIIKLPTPEEVRAMVKDFVPAPRRHWKERKRPQSRTNAAKEERRRRGPRRSLGTSLDRDDKL